MNKPVRTWLIICYCAPATLTYLQKAKTANEALARAEDKLIQWHMEPQIIVEITDDEGIQYSMPVKRQITKPRWTASSLREE